MPDGLEKHIKRFAECYHAIELLWDADILTDEGAVECEHRLLYSIIEEIEKFFGKEQENEHDGD